MAGGFVKGLQKNGITATLKHFVCKYHEIYEKVGA